MNLSEFEKCIGYQFKDRGLLDLALTHSSFTNEKKKDKFYNNERLEFLGDAVLELVVSEYIYHAFPRMPEGELTRLRASIVCEATLSKLAKKYKYGLYINLGKGEEAGGGRERDSILADTFEAVLGAVYLDDGILGAKKFVFGMIRDEISSLKNTFKTMDCKTYLQEVIQRNSKEPLEYNIISETGPDHDKNYVVHVTHDGHDLGKGFGKSKKEAEQNAAYNALKCIDE